MKTNMISSASEAACLILSIDETVTNPSSEQAKMGPAGQGPPQGGGRRRNRKG